MKQKVLVGGVLALAAAQAVPVSRENPPIEEEVSAPPAVRAILERACYDCHSHETHWPWYAYVAPVSWLVAYDVSHARKHVNFSTWNRYDAEKRRENLKEAWKEIDEGEMPLWYYLPLHPHAGLSEDDRRLLRSWAVGARDDAT